MKFLRFEVLCFILYFCTYTLATSETDSNDSISIFTSISQNTLGEDGKLNFTQLVNKYGHSVKQYDVITEDGYILTIFNIPGDRNRPVLCLHGLFDSSDTYVMRGNTSLGITLANKGYDVWVGNVRGNTYARRHISLDPDTDEEFWDYSFHEIGYYDLAAMIDFVRQITGAKKISTIGHSQGTSAHFVLLSTRPDYNQKIKVFIALAPIAFVNHEGVAAAGLKAAAPVIVTLLKSTGIHEVLKDHNAAFDLIKQICSKGKMSYMLCGKGLTGSDAAELEPEYLTKTAIGHFPRAASRKCLEHYAQVISGVHFRMFDYGIGNMAKYGSLHPPDYDLKAVTAKVALFIGRRDKLGTVKDVERLMQDLPHVVHHQIIDSFGHLAFVSGKNMPKYLFPNLLRILKTYNRS